MSDTFANSVDHQDQNYLPFCSWFTTVTLLAVMDVSKFRDGTFFFKNSGLKVLLTPFRTPLVFNYFFFDNWEFHHSQVIYTMIYLYKIFIINGISLFQIECYMKNFHMGIVNGRFGSDKVLTFCL